MKENTTFAFLVGCLPFLCLSAAVTVSDVPSYVMTNGEEIVVQTASLRDYPYEIGQPSFWLDCSMTNDWTVIGDEVVQVPSRVLDGCVNSRFLTIDCTDGVFPWQPAAPVFVDDGSLRGGFLDFGSVGSKRGLIFNAVLETGCTQATNMLRSIGTVVAVYNADQGGGYLLGGGAVTPGWSQVCDGYLWTRSTYDGLVSPHIKSIIAPVFSSNNSAQRFRWGSVLHNGVDSTPHQVGFSGNWEILATEAREAAESGIFATGFPEAAGIGINDSRANQGKIHGGGMKIAEMLLYDRRLSREELKRLEVYLRSKWMNGSQSRSDGWNGDARMGQVSLSSPAFYNKATVAGIDVPAGETMRIGRLSGGRSPAEDTRTPRFIKTGGGRLVLDGAHTYNGTVELAEGELAFERRSVPSLNDLPTNMVARFDMSDESSYTLEEGTARMRQWRNLAVGTDSLYKEKFAITLEATDASLQPTVLSDLLGPGKNVLCFGNIMTSAGGCRLAFTADGAEIKLPLTTVIAAYSIPNSPGSLMNEFFGREGDGGGSFAFRYMVSPSSSHGYTSTGSFATYTNGVIYIDGRRLASDARFDRIGNMTYAHQSMIASTIGAQYVGSPNKTANSGGIRLMELIVYRRPLSEREIVDVQAYLADKWYNRALPGYARSADDTEDEIQKLAVTGNAEIDVPADATVTIGSLSIAEGVKLVKKGAGTLNIRGGEGLTTGVSVAEGRVEFAGRRVVSDESAIAASPSLHLDAAGTYALDTYLENGTNFVRNWYSPDFDSFAFVPTYWNPTSNSGTHTLCPWVDTEETLNGYPVIDFGEYNGSPSDSTSNPSMTFGRALNGVRSAYVVIKFKDGCGQLLGSSRAVDADAEYCDFSRNNYGKAGDRLFLNGTGSTMAGSQASILTNGVPTDYKVVPDGGFQLVEVHTAGGAHASALACDRYKGIDVFKARQGGVKIAEVVIYERELSDREKVSTRNRLMKKWFNAEPQELPSAPVEEHVFWRLERDLDSDGFTTVPGAVVLAEGAVIELANFTDEDCFRSWIIAKGASVTLPSGKVQVLINGHPLDDARYNVAFRADADGNLKIRITKPGMVMTIR